MEKAEDQELLIKNQNASRFTGIKEILVFEPKQCVFVSDQTKITVRGNNLRMNSFDDRNGILEFDGLVENINFAKKMTTKQIGNGLVKRLFQ